MKVAESEASQAIEIEESKSSPATEIEESKASPTNPYKQPRITRFKDWENSEDVPYTQMNVGARKNKKTDIYSSPNEPGHQPEAPCRSPLDPSEYTPDPREQGPRTPLHGRRPGTDPLHREPAPRRHTNPRCESIPRSPSTTAAGSASPVQPNSPSKLKHRAAGLHTPERRALSEVHGGSRMNQSNQRHNEVAVPTFGAWDESNASSSESYAHIFSRVREDKSSDNHREEKKVQQTCPCCIL